MTRDEANLLILDVLEVVARSYPEQRFTQLMINLGIGESLSDRYNEEPIFTLQWLLAHPIVQQLGDHPTIKTLTTLYGVKNARTEDT